MAEGCAEGYQKFDVKGDIPITDDEIDRLNRKHCEHLFQAARYRCDRTGV